MISDKAAITALTETVTGLASDARGIKDELTALTEQKARDRRLLKALLTLFGLQLLALGLLVVITLDTNTTSALIKSCTDPAGECAQRSEARTGAAIVAITYRTEAERLRTEIFVAEQKGDHVSAALRQTRLHEIEKALADAGK